MPRVLYVQHNPEISGSPLSLLDLVEQLRHTGYEPHVLFHCGDGPGPELFRRRGIPTTVRNDITYYAHGECAHHSFRSERPWRPVTDALRILPSAGRMYAFLRSRSFDLIHLNSSVQAPAAIGARLAGVPIVWHMRERLRRGVFGLRRALLRRIIEACADGIIAISKDEAVGLRPSEKVSVIYEFVNFGRFDRSVPPDVVREEFGLARETPVVGMLGGTLPYKGAHILLEAVGLLRRDFTDLRVLIVGCRPAAESPRRLRRLARRVLSKIFGARDYGAEMRACIRRLDLATVVSLVGVRTDVPAVLSALDVLVFPATGPHFPRPVIEAGAMSKPVVASALGGAQEVVQDGKTGFLVPPSDPAQLAGAIARLLKDRDLARAMGDAGYQQARQRSDAKRNVDQILGVYDRVLGLAHRPTER